MLVKGHAASKSQSRGPGWGGVEVRSARLSNPCPQCFGLVAAGGKSQQLKMSERQVLEITWSSHHPSTQVRGLKLRKGMGQGCV